MNDNTPPPFFTIITATRNVAVTLPRLLSSLAEQTCRDFELIIQDGASTDDTVHIAEQWRERLPRLSIASEKDTGIYDAWNKALLQAHGIWCIFLGADDYLDSPTVIKSAKDILWAVPEHFIFAAGHGQVVFSDGTIHCIQNVDLTRSEELLRVGAPVCHPALFYRRQLFATDAFNTCLRVAADYEFLCRYWDPAHVYVLNFMVSNMVIGGVSSNAKTRILTLRETMPIAKKRFGTVPQELQILYIKSLIHAGLHSILGEKWGNALYDILRRLNGKESFWGRT